MKTTSIERWWLGLATLIVAGGCSGSKAKYDIRPISRDGYGYYQRSNETYLKARARSEASAEWQESMDSAMRELRAAASTNEDCPLFHSKLGELYLDLGNTAIANAHDKADDSMNQSLSLCTDWVPGWLGLARLETQRGGANPEKLYDAETSLEKADEAITALKDKAKKEGLGKFNMTGFGVPTEKDDESERNDASLTPKQEIALLTEWLALNEQWTPENPSLMVPVAGMGQWQVSPESVFKRLRAWVEFRRAEVALQRRDPAPDVVTWLRKALDWDRDLAPARMQMALELVKQGQYHDAESWLAPYLRDDAHPIYRNNVVLQTIAAKLYCAWYEHGHDARCVEAGEKALDRLLELHPNDGEAWLLRGRLLWSAATRESALDAGQRCEWLGDAKECGQHAQGSGVDPGGATQLLNDIGKSRAALSCN